MTHPSVFSFFPTKGAKIIVSDGNSIASNFYDIDFWKEQKLGPFSSPRTAEYEVFFRKVLDQGYTFRRLLVPRKDLPETPVLIVAARNRQTLSQIIKDGPQSYKGWDISATEKSLGDGQGSLVKRLSRRENEISSHGNHF